MLRKQLHPSFYFTMYDSLGNPVDAIGDSNFSAVEIDVDQFGNLETPLTGPGISGGPQGGPTSAAPAPSSALLLAMGSFCVGAYRLWRRAHTNERGGPLEKEDKPF
jgi:hypothetical protein